METPLLDGIRKMAGETRGVPDGTGPYGRGAGPGQGKADGTGAPWLKEYDIAAQMHAETYNLQAILKNKPNRIEYDPKRRMMYTKTLKRGSTPQAWFVRPGPGTGDGPAVLFEEYIPGGER